MVVTANLRLEVDKLKEVGKNYVPVQMNQSEPVFGYVKRVLKEIGRNIYVCEVEVYPEHEKYVLDKMEQELKG